MRNETTISKWGNSLAVRIPLAIARQASLAEGDVVELALDGEGGIVLRPAKRKYELSDLVARIAPRNRHRENARSGLALICPIANQAKGYPFEAAVPADLGATGVILADHVKSIDWKARQAELLGRCSGEVLEEVRARLEPLLGY